MYELHPFCLAFRRANTQELTEIVASMQAYGYDQEQPITLYEGKILDGSARDKAAEMTNIKAVYVEFIGDEDEAIAFVLRRNKARKHMNNGELNLAAARLVTAKKGRPKLNLDAGANLFSRSNLKTRKMVAEASGQSLSMIDKTRLVLCHAAPNIIAMIEAGEVSSALACAAITGMKKEDQLRLTSVEVRKIGNAYKNDHRRKKVKLAKMPKPVAPHRLVKLTDVDIGTERIPGQPVMFQPAYVQRLTEASIRVRGIAGRVEGCASMMLDIFNADIKSLLAHVPVRGKKNGEERNYAGETEKTLATIAQHIDAALEKLAELRICVTKKDVVIVKVS